MKRTAPQLFLEDPMNKSPCKDCPDRSIDPPCHDICEKYLDFRKSVVNRSRAKRKERNERDAFIRTRNFKKGIGQQ